MRRSAAAIFVLVLAAVTFVSAPAAAATPYCGIYWGSLAKTSPPLLGWAPIHNVRSGQHPCYDRIVIDTAGPRSSLGYDVSYVAQVTGDGDPSVVYPVRGGARLSVLLRFGVHDGAGNVTYNPRNRLEAVNVTGYRTLRQVRYAGSYEGNTLFAVGVRARLPYRVFTLAGPGTGSRLVIDVAHAW